MPDVDMTSTISANVANVIIAAIAIAAIFSPVCTTILNIRYQYKIRKLELKQHEYEQTVLYKRTIFENFLQGLSQVAQNPTDEAIDLFAKYYPLAYMYLPEHVQKTLAEINLLIQKKYWDEIVKYVDLITTDIHEELVKL